MDTVMILIVATAIAIGLFFLLRNINLWYFRINEGIERMDKQIELLEQIKNHLANGQTTVKADNGNKVSSSKVVTAKVENYTKSNNIYSLINGDKYEVVKDGDFFYFEYSDKKYYYADINAAENSLNEIAMAKDPSKKDLVSVKNK